MTPEEAAAKKGRMYALIGVSLAAFYGAYQFVTSPPPAGVPSPLLPAIFVTAGLVCLIIAALLARSLSKESVAK